MIFSPEEAKKCQVLVHPDVEKAIFLLLEIALRPFENIQDNPEATDAQLRQFQGQKMLVKELKDYKNRLNDAVKGDRNGRS